MKILENKKCFLIWPREDQLSRNLALALGLQVVLAQAKNPGAHFLVRYFEQSVRTIKWLFRERPRFVFIQNPPLLPILIVSCFSFFYPKTKFGVDNHSVFFRSKKWRHFHFFGKFIFRKSIIVTAHNKFDLQILRRWQVPSLEVQFATPDLDKGALGKPLENKKLAAKIEKSTFPVLVVNRFAPNDDDFPTIRETAKNNPNWDFFITGDPGLLESEEKEGLPANLIFTGYLEHIEFLKLMARSKVALCLTLRNKTVLWSIREALALRKVFVTTDTGALRHYFSKIAIFSQKRDSQDLALKIKEAIAILPEETRKKFNRFLLKDKERMEREIRKARFLIKKGLE